MVTTILSIIIVLLFISMVLVLANSPFNYPEEELKRTGIVIISLAIFVFSLWLGAEVEEEVVAETLYEHDKIGYKFDKNMDAKPFLKDSSGAYPELYKEFIKE